MKLLERIHEVEQLCLAFPEDYELLCQYIDKEASMLASLMYPRQEKRNDH